MKERVKKLWLAALRSGKYRQGHDQLRIDTWDEHGNITLSRFCCLGVLCDLYVKEHSNAEWDISGRHAIRPHFGKLTREVADWAGLENVDPRVQLPHDDSKSCVLSFANDHDRTFSEIADAIERDL